MMAGNVFNNLSSPDSFMDDVLSVVLIIMFLAFMLYFVVGAANGMRSFCLHLPAAALCSLFSARLPFSQFAFLFIDLFPLSLC
jgi:hypothetical protein